MFFNPITHMRLGIHVDDIIARGSRKQTRLFWAARANKYSLKMTTQLFIQAIPYVKYERMDYHGTRWI